MNRLNDYNFATVLSVPYYQGLKRDPFDCWRGELVSHQCYPGSVAEPGVICGLNLLLVLYVYTLQREVFYRVLRFFPLLKSQHFQIVIPSWVSRALLTPWCSVSKQIYITFTYIYNKPFLQLTKTIKFWTISRLTVNFSKLLFFNKN